MQLPAARTLLELAKPRITLASTFTALLGYAVADAAADARLAFLAAGIFLLACGSAALNQVQEAAIDARVQRTAARPIPSGRISRRAALLYALLLVAAGTLLLALPLSLATAVTGLSGALLYNGVYTPLKRVTPFAVIPGALIGGVPPLAGWLAAGGPLLAPGIHQLCFFFFVWQIPHFWLLLLLYEQHYTQNGLPSLFDRFDAPQIARLSFVWITATAVSGIAMPLFAFVRHREAGLVIAAAAFLVVWKALELLPRPAAPPPPPRAYRRRFMEVNGYALWVTLVLLLDRI